MNVLFRALDPWERWAVIHGGELLPDGRPRFRILLLLVARQNGKTWLLVVLALFWIFVDRVEMIVGMSTNLDMAAEPWDRCIELADETPALRQHLPKDKHGDVREAGWVKRDNNKREINLTFRDEDGGRARYKLAARTRRGGRSLSIDRLIMDEVREHDTWDAYNAAVNAMNARPYAQAWLASNMGDDKSVLLDYLHAVAVGYIETGEGDPRLGLLEYSAPEGSDPTDLEALAMANPNLGHRIDADALVGAARAAVASGDAVALNSFLTEVMCIRVRGMRPAIHPVHWAACMVPGDLERVRDRVALVADVSPDRQHAAVVAAAVLPDGRARVEVVKAYSGPTAVKDLRAGIGALLGQVKPKAFGWLPGGPGAVLDADFTRRGDRPPRILAKGIDVAPVRGELSAVCMGFAALVDAHEILHADDPLLNLHALGAQQLDMGVHGQWVFSRRGGGHCDTVYAAAAAVHLAKTLAESPGRQRILVSVEGR